MQNRTKTMELSIIGFLLSLSLAMAAEPAAPAKETPPPFVKWTSGPYLQNPSETGMTICFVSDYAQDVSAIVEPTSITVSQDVAPTPIPGTSATVWKVRLTGLDSGTEYRYHIDYTADGKKVVGNSYQFKTPSPEATTAKCLVVNDVHNRAATLEALMKHVKDDYYEFSILLGDCWNDPRWEGDGRKIITTLTEFVRLLNAAEKPMLYVRGNHECRGNFSGKLGYLFDLPNLNPAAPYYDQNFYFSHQVGPLYLLFNDAGEDGDKRMDKFEPYRKRQADWLADEIKKPEYQAATYHVFASHIPLYNVNYWKAKYCQEFWSPVLAQANIDLTLGAHDHQWRVLEKNGPCPNKQCEKLNQVGQCGHSSPHPLFIGGGPSLQEGTVMLLKADKRNLSVRTLNTAGKTLAQLKLPRESQSP